MFITKDTRKIPEILVDEDDDRTKLMLARRSTEFKGSLRVLCNPTAVQALGNLETLSLYGCDLSRTKVRTEDGVGLAGRATLAVGGGGGGVAVWQRSGVYVGVCVGDLRGDRVQQRSCVLA